MKTIIKKIAYILCLSLTVVMFQNCAGEGAENTAQSLDLLDENIASNDLVPDAPAADENDVVYTSASVPRQGWYYFSYPNGQKSSYYVWSSGQMCKQSGRAWGTNAHTSRSGFNYIYRIQESGKRVSQCRYR